MTLLTSACADCHSASLTCNAIELIDEEALPTLMKSILIAFFRHLH